MPTPRPIIDARIGANTATSSWAATSGRTKPVLIATETAAETIGSRAPASAPKAKSRMTSATAIPMLSDDGSSPETNAKTPLAPTCRPVFTVLRLDRLERGEDVFVVEVVEGRTFEGHRRVGHVRRRG